MTEEKDGYVFGQGSVFGILDDMAALRREREEAEKNGDKAYFEKTYSSLGDHREVCLENKDVQPHKLLIKLVKPKKRRFVRIRYLKGNKKGGGKSPLLPNATVHVPVLGQASRNTEKGIAIPTPVAAILFVVALFAPTVGIAVGIFVMKGMGSKTFGAVLMGFSAMLLVFKMFFGF